MGLLTVAYPAARSDLERATERFRLFREQPTPELARQARAGMEAALSPNDRLQQLYHSWTSYLIVPLFALPGSPSTGSFWPGRSPHRSQSASSWATRWASRSGSSAPAGSPPGPA